MRKCRQRCVHERYGLSFNTEEMASVKSLIRGLPHLGSSYNEVPVLPSAKRLRSFFTSSLSKGQAPLSHRLNSVRRRSWKCGRTEVFECECEKTDECSLFHEHPQRTSTSMHRRPSNRYWAHVVGATQIFEREIGEEDIVCQIQLLIMISVYHWTRYRVFRNQ
jgi:hypothetical protein